MKNTYQDAMTLFFIKYPEPGGVKTRLAAKIGDKEATELYRNFILDILIKLETSGIPFRICFLPEKKKGLLKAWLGNDHPYSPQKGKDLGERMKYAFVDAFSEDYKRVILIGSDYPDLPSSFLKDALVALHTHDAVLGPAVDGGYYLIGFRDNEFVPTIFEGIAWGTEQVYRATFSKLKDHKKHVYILPPWNDVDTLEDLRELITRSQGSNFSNSRTLSFISQMGWGFITET